MQNHLKQCAAAQTQHFGTPAQNRVPEPAANPNVNKIDTWKLTDDGNQGGNDDDGRRGDENGARMLAAATNELGRGNEAEGDDSTSHESSEGRRRRRPTSHASQVGNQVLMLTMLKSVSVSTKV